jgi:hypothetical protein
MKTLIIIPDMYYTRFRMKGLSIRKVHELCVDESGYFIDNRFKINGKTALISVPELVKFLNELKEEIPFDKIIIKGKYEISAEELINKLDKD